MRWWTEANGLLSNKGYFISRTRMSHGWWHNAFAPRNRGVPIASGQLERCMEACERHNAGEMCARDKRRPRSLPPLQATA